MPGGGTSMENVGVLGPVPVLVVKVLEVLYVVVTWVLVVVVLKAPLTGTVATFSSVRGLSEVGLKG